MSLKSGTYTLVTPTLLVTMFVFFYTFSNNYFVTLQILYQGQSSTSVTLKKKKAS